MKTYRLILLSISLISFVNCTEDDENEVASLTFSVTDPIISKKAVQEGLIGDWEWVASEFIGWGFETTIETTL